MNKLEGKRQADAINVWALACCLELQPKPLLRPQTGSL